MKVGEAYVAIRGDTRALSGDLDQAGGKIKSNLGGIAATMGGLAVGAFMGSAVKDAQEAEAASAKLDSIFRTMGGTIQSTSATIADHASKLQKLTAIDDDAIKGGASLLLTFAGLREGVGKTGQGFDRVLTTTAGLAKFWGKDMDAMSTLVGKALDQPITGLAALGKMGIKFSEDQKAVIKSMVETGDVAGAQRLMLDELGRQGGDAGLEMATGSEKAASAYAEMKEGVGAGLVPVMNSLGRVLVPILDAFGKLPGPVQTALVAMVGVAAVAPRMSATAKALGSLGPIAERMGPSVAKGAGKIGPAVVGGLAKLGPMIASAGAALGPVLMTALPWIALVAGIIIVGVLIWKFFKSDLPGKIWDAMKDAGKWLLEAGGKIIDGLWEGLKKIADIYKFFYIDLPLKVAGAFLDAGKWLLDAGWNMIKGLAEGIIKADKFVFDAIKGIIGKVKNFITSGFGIFSPSAVFAGYGENMMVGLANGIAGAAGRPQKALAGMRLDVPTLGVPRLGAATAGTGGAGVTVNLDLRGAVVGVDDLTDKVAAGLEARDRRLGALG